MKQGGAETLSILDRETVMNLGFHTVRRGIDLGGHRFLGSVGFVDPWIDFSSVDGTLSSPSGGGSCFLYGWNNLRSIQTFSKNPPTSGIGLAHWVRLELANGVRGSEFEL